MKRLGDIAAQLIGWSVILLIAFGGYKSFHVLVDGFALGASQGGAVLALGLFCLFVVIVLPLVGYAFRRGKIDRCETCEECKCKDDTDILRRRRATDRRVRRYRRRNR
jgi:hypothetical protein